MAIEAINSNKNDKGPVVRGFEHFFFDTCSVYPYYCALMSAPPLQKPLPRLADARKFAQQRVDLAGYITVSALPRLREVVERDTTFAVHLSFGLDEQHRRRVTGSAQGDAVMICQRCLEPVTVPINCNIALAIVQDEEQAAQLPRAIDPWLLEGEGPNDLYHMIEEELLLTLPAVAYHTTQCVPESLFSSGETEANEAGAGADAEADRDNPFQVLEQLKGSPKS